MLSIAWQEDWEEHWIERFPWKGVLAAVITAFVYVKLFSYPFHARGDPMWILQSPFLSPPINVLKAWVTPFQGLYTPLTHTIWAIVASISSSMSGSLSPLYFHATNLIFHLASVVLVYLIINRWIDSQWSGFVGALVFGIHPIQVEAVVEVASFGTVCSTTFALGAIYAHMRYIEYNDRRSYWATFALFVLALFSNPTVAILPLIIGFITKALSDKKRKEIIKELSPFVGVSLIFLAIALMIQPQITGPPWLYRPFIALDALGFYFKKALFPFSLSPDYGKRLEWILPTQPSFSVFVTLSVISGCFFLRKRLTFKGVGHGLLLSFVILIPFLGLWPFELQNVSTVSDRFAYFSIFGFGFAVAWIFSQFGNWRPIQALMAFMLFLCVIASFIQIEKWESNEAIFRDTLSQNPKSFSSHLSLGDHFAMIQEPKKSLHHFENSYKILPSIKAIEGIAQTYLKLDDLKNAMLAFEIGAKRFQESKLFYEAGKLRWHFGEHDIAQSHFEKALTLKPDYRLAQKNLASLKGFKKLASLRLEKYPSDETSETLLP